MSTFVIGSIATLLGALVTGIVLLVRVPAQNRKDDAEAANALSDAAVDVTGVQSRMIEKLEERLDAAEERAEKAEQRAEKAERRAAAAERRAHEAEQNAEKLARRVGALEEQIAELAARRLP